MEKNLKSFKKEITPILKLVESKLKEYHIHSGQIRIQVEDFSESMYARKIDYTEEDPVVIHTGSGILLASKLNF